MPHLIQAHAYVGGQLNFIPSNPVHCVPCRYDMGLWLAMRDVFSLITPYEDIILDGRPVPEGWIYNSSEHAVVNGMMGTDGSVLIASSSMPMGREVVACVRSSFASQHWRLCDLSTNATVASTSGKHGGASTCWRTATETGSLLLFGSHTPCAPTNP